MEGVSDRRICRFIFWMLLILFVHADNIQQQGTFVESVFVVQSVAPFDEHRDPSTFVSYIRLR
jgi:hypothetical protein